MNLFSTIQLVLRTLLARKGRSFLTILGIVIGVAGVIIIISLGDGAQSLVLGQVTKAHEGKAGIYGATLVEGVVRVGDEIELLS